VNVTRADLAWTVVSTETPLVVKDCPKCSKRSCFVCSEKFRVNAQKRSLDVWLIYRCEACDSTWNCRLLRRVAPTAIDPALYEQFLNNDGALARRCAFDLTLLKSNGVKVEPRGEVGLDGPELVPDAFPSGIARVLITCELAGPWRLNRLLSAKLGVSRARLEKLFREGQLELDPPVRKLRAALAGRTLLVVRVGALRELAEAACLPREAELSASSR
jgi:hypothetical protein